MFNNRFALLVKLKKNGGKMCNDNTVQNVSKMSGKCDFGKCNGPTRRDVSNMHVIHTFNVPARTTWWMSMSQYLIRNIQMIFLTGEYFASCV